MNETFKIRIVREAKELWDAGHALEAGRLIFERIPRDRQAEWAARVLETACGYFAPSPQVNAALEFAKNPGKRSEEKEWREAQDIVDKIPYSPIISELARNVGKVVYNSQELPMPYDLDAGWEVADVLKRMVHDVSDAEFETRVWATLCDEEFIKLKVPPWYRYLAENLPFPFKARYIGADTSSSLKNGDEVEVIKMASEEDCLHELLVEIRWSEQTLAIPLRQIRPIEPDDKTQEAIFFVERLGHHSG